jgi:hypothetical protein
MAYTCGTISTGFEIGCVTPGGNSELFIGTWAEATVWSTDQTVGITAVTGSGTFWKFNQPTDIIAIGGDTIFSKENRTSGFDSSITFKLFGLSTETFEQLITLQKTYVTAIVKTRAGKYLVFGVETPGYLEVGTGGIEATRDGSNGYTLTLKWDDTRPPYEMSSTVFVTDITVG